MRLGKKRGIGPARLGLAGAGFLGSKAIGSGDTNHEPKAETSTSAPAKTCEVVNQGPATPENLVGVPTTSSLDLLNTTPSQELINDALKPVTVAAFPDPKDAAARLYAITNLYDLSGDTEETGTGSGFPLEKPASEAEGKKLITNVYSNTLLNNPSTKLGDEYKMRRFIGMENDYFKTRPSDFQAKHPATWSQTWISSDVTKINEVTYEVTGLVEFNSNFDSRYLDKDVRKNIPNYDIKSTPTVMTLSNEGGVWKIAKIEVTE